MRIFNTLLANFLLTALVFNELYGSEDQCRIKYDLSRCYSTNISYLNETVACDNTSNDICDKSFNVSYVQMEPYNINILDFVLKMCCGGCNKLTVTRTFNHIWQITPKTMLDTQLVFPVLGPAISRRMHGYHFLPLVESSFIYYITEREVDTLPFHFMYSCLSMWPVILICLMFAAIAGFVCWITETWSNDQFPRPFLTGWFEGFWWSFITMTTVGYGDRVPKTTSARLFSVLWILTGIIAFSALTAAFSTKMNEVNNPSLPTMAGKRVGAMRHRLLEGAVIAQGGGLLVDVESGNDTETVFQLIRMLRNRKINGFILDRYTYVTLCEYMASNLSSNHHLSGDIQYMKTRTIQTEKTYTGQRLSFGVLVRDDEDYDYFVDFVTGSEILINVCCGLAINHIHAKREIHVTYMEDQQLFTVHSGLFWPTLVAATGVLVSICCFGFLYEAWRKKAGISQQFFIAKETVVFLKRTETV